MKICNDTEPATCVSSQRSQRDKQQEIFEYLDTVRHGRNYTPAKTINDLSSFMTRDEFAW